MVRKILALKFASEKEVWEKVIKEIKKHIFTQNPDTMKNAI